jgi:ribosome-associated toxin RatA of RatAB toxin-antitoxin module
MKNGTLAMMTLACALSSSASLATPPSASAPTEPAPSNEPRVDATPVPGSSIERVRATVAVDVPIERLRAVVFDFPRYPEFLPHYRRGTIERRNPSGSVEVRLDMEELGGAVHVWVRLEVAAAEHAGAAESYGGRLLAGNVKAFQTRWELEALGPTRTRLTLESFMDPNLSVVPSAFINHSARERIRDVILAMKARAERGA